MSDLKADTLASSTPHPNKLTPEMLESPEAKLIGFLPYLLRAYQNKTVKIFSREEELIEGSEREVIVLGQMVHFYIDTNPSISELEYVQILSILRSSANEYVEPYKEKLLRAIDLYEGFMNRLDQEFNREGHVKPTIITYES